MARSGERPLVIGHRGERRVGPENSMAAFERARREGADGIELDVRLARTGEVVVLHDEDVARVTSGADTRRADAMSLAEIRSVDLGRGERIPLLSDVLELARSLDVFVNVELKRDVPDRTALVRTVAREFGRQPRAEIVFSSFDPIMLAGLAVLAPRVPRALLIHRSSYHHAMLRAQPLSLRTGLHIEHVLLRDELFFPGKAFIARQRFVNTWTVNSGRDAIRLAALGVSGIITDDPARIRAALAAASI